MKKKHLTRRRFLQGMGGITVALPTLASQVARAQAAALPPRRAFFLGFDHATPKAAFLDMNSVMMEPLAPYVGQMLRVVDLDNRIDAVPGNDAGGHSMHAWSTFTATARYGAFGATNNNREQDLQPGVEPRQQGGANSESIDNVIATHLQGAEARPFHSLGAAISGHPGNLSPQHGEEYHDSRFFHEGRNTPASLTNRPNLLFERLFGSVSQTSLTSQALEYIRRRNLSVLDAVRSSFQDLMSQVDSAERPILNAHFEQLRQLELDLSQTRGCAAPDADPYNQQDYTDLLQDAVTDLMRRLLVLGMSCDLAPVFQMEFYHQQSPRFGVPDVDSWLDNMTDPLTDWHGATHISGEIDPTTGQVIDGGWDGDASYLLQRGYRTYNQCFADVMRDLEQTVRADGSNELEHTMLVKVSELNGTGEGHAARKGNWILAGNTGTITRRGVFNAAPNAQHFYSAGDYQHQQLLVSIANAFGIPLNQFGMQSGDLRTGNIPALFG